MNLNIVHVHTSTSYIAALLLNVPLLFVMCVPSLRLHVSASPVSKNSECTHIFQTYNSCPQKGIDYEQSHAVCCDNSTTQKLHCVLSYNQRGDSIIATGCFEEMRVPTGAYLLIDSCLHTQKCDPGYYEPDDRLSSDAQTAYCTNMQTKCDGDGQQLLCTGGASTDNQCACKPGYRPDNWPHDKVCSQGFASENNCACIENNCEKGMRRNITWKHDGLCPKDPIPLDYKCYDNSLFASAGKTKHPLLMLILPMICFSVCVPLSAGCGW